MKIDINDGDKVLEVAAGSTLLNTLGEQGIFLPSACGGKGACGQCKCQVVEGGGSILPTETGFFNRRQILDNWRLGCQVKVKEDMKIKVPASVLSIKKWECEVVSNHNVATFIKEFVVKLPEGEHLNFRSGGYIQIDVPAITVDYKDIDVDPEYREDWEKMGVFNLKMVNPEPQVRAYSCATYPAEGDIIKLNVRIATPPFDRAKGRFHGCQPGRMLVVYLFAQTGRQDHYVGSVRRVLPARQPARRSGARLHRRRCRYGAHALAYHAPVPHRKDQASGIVLLRCPFAQRGLLSRRLPPDRKDFPNFRFNLALDRPDPEADAAGVKYTPGFVHNVLYETYLKNHEEPEGIIYLMCGPPMMSQSVVNLLDSLGVPPENILFDNFGA